MWCQFGRCNQLSTPQGIFFVSPPLDKWPTKARGAFSLQSKTDLPDTITVFLGLRNKPLAYC